MKIKKMLQRTLTIAITMVIMSALIVAATFVPSTPDTISDNLIAQLKEGDRFFTFNTHGLQIDAILYPITEDPELFNAHYAKTRYLRIGDLWFLYIPNKYQDISITQLEIDSVTNAILNDLDIFDKSDFEKAYAIYDWICQNIEYEHLDDYKDQDMYYALLHKKSVCAGLSKAFVYLLNQVGVDGVVVRGKAIDSEIHHMWAVAYLDGVPYVFDITNDIWKDSGYYEYFAITSDEIAKRYTISPYSKSIDCTNTEYNLLIKRNMVVQNGSVDEIIQLLQEENGCLLAKCMNDEIYTNAITSLTCDELEERIVETYGKDATMEIYYNPLVNTIGCFVITTSNESLNK